MKITNFEDLEIWRESIDLSVRIYQLTTLNPNLSSDFSLKDQLRRSSVSISSNIAEGFERNNNNELVRFLLIAKGSLGELRSQLILANELKYIGDEEFEILKIFSIELSKKIGKFISYLMRLRKAGEYKKSK